MDDGRRTESISIQSGDINFRGKRARATRLQGFLFVPYQLRNVPASIFFVMILEKEEFASSLFRTAESVNNL